MLYNRGLINSMIGVEAIRTAQKKYGNKPLTGEQVRWGFENLDLTAARIKELGFEGMIAPIKFSCQDHQGADQGRVQQWDGKEWKIISDFYTADRKILDPMVKDACGQVRRGEEDRRARLLEGELTRSCQRTGRASSLSRFSPGHTFCLSMIFSESRFPLFRIML